MMIYTRSLGLTLVDIYYVLQVANLGLLLCQLSTRFSLAIMHGEVTPCILAHYMHLLLHCML